MKNADMRVPMPWKEILMVKKTKQKNPPIDQKELEFQQRVRERHAELFFEEYDYMFDSLSEARNRQRGLSPMRASYLEKTNDRRVAMGFEPLSDSGHATSRDTYDFVEKKMRAGEEVILPEITPLKAISTEEHQSSVQSDSCPVSAILASDAFLSKGVDRNDPEVIAVRILGALFKLYSRKSNEPLFFEYIKKELPDLNEKEYQRLYRFAMNEWVEAYGG
jgi:hypothetical protein